MKPKIRLCLTLFLTESEWSSLEERIEYLNMTKATYFTNLFRQDVGSFQSLGFQHQPPEQKPPEPISLLARITKEVEQQNAEDEALGLVKKQRRSVPLLEKNEGE